MRREGERKTARGRQRREGCSQHHLTGKRLVSTAGVGGKREPEPGAGREQCTDDH